ncbi:MAG: hypothetical protein JSV03_12705 [Planctomycetota bacterium]|nr:MAG: hypothetical protein JSV03_12705 [Planctomycetota bacterium]
MNNSVDERWLRWVLTSIAVLLAIIAIELSALVGPFMQQAQAQIPDSGLQRIQLLESQVKTNSTLGQILQHLRTQTIKVKVVSTDKDIKSTPQPKRKASKK